MEKTKPYDIYEKYTAIEVFEIAKTLNIELSDMWWEPDYTDKEKEMIINILELDINWQVPYDEDWFTTIPKRD